MNESPPIQDEVRGQDGYDNAVGLTEVDDSGRLGQEIDPHNLAPSSCLNERSLVDRHSSICAIATREDAAGPLTSMGASYEPGIEIPRTKLR